VDEARCPDENESVEQPGFARTADAHGDAALIITYHDIAVGRSPLQVSPELLGAHLDCLAEYSATPMTISDFARSLRESRLPPRPVCLTFDDGFASFVDAAVPLLLERGFPATVFAVAGYLGKTNDWPSQPAWVERRPLADAAQLAELARAGFEVGAHGLAHEPLCRATPEVLQREVVDGRTALEDAVGVSIASFAYPYGSLPQREARALVMRTYAAACTTSPDLVRPGSNPAALPRVDAHHLRGTDSLRRLLEGSGRARLGARRAARRLRRIVHAD
jgi:peptidoglycan/xylan/chitin deacetylase (PgdA/CDA1 family)